MIRFISRYLFSECQIKMKIEIVKRICGMNKIWDYMDLRNLWSFGWTFREFFFLLCSLTSGLREVVKIVPGNVEIFNDFYGSADYCEVTQVDFEWKYWWRIMKFEKKSQLLIPTLVYFPTMFPIIDSEIRQILNLQHANMSTQIKPPIDLYQSKIYDNLKICKWKCDI